MSRRSNGEGTAPYPYRTGKAAWAAQLTVRGIDGRSRRLTVYGATRQECLEKRRRKEAEARRGPTATSRPPTLAAYGRDWLNVTLPAAIAMKRLQPSTRSSYRDVWCRHIEPELGHLRLDELAPPILRAWLLRKASTPTRLGRPLSADSQRIIFAVLRKALNDAVRDGLIPENPLRRVDGPRGGDRRAAGYLTPQEARDVLAAAKDHRLHALWVLLIAVGLRVGEAVALEWDAVNLDDATVKITRSVGRVRGDFDPGLGRHRTELVLKAPKTPASAATVALPTYAVDALRQHRTRQAAERLASRLWVDNSLVFTTTIGSILESRSVLLQLKGLCRTAGVSHNVRTHDLRHTAASLMLASGVDLRVVGAVLRHTRLSTTSDVYGHVYDEVRREAATAMDRTLRGLDPQSAAVDV